MWPTSFTEIYTEVCTSLILTYAGIAFYLVIFLRVRACVCMRVHVCMCVCVLVSSEIVSNPIMQREACDL